jgi:transcriptional regulator with XRE-family HTH domain
MAKTNKLTKLIYMAISANGVKQTEMADALGLEKPNIITMWKQGDSRIPFDRIPGIAVYLKLDVKELLRLWLEIYEPEHLKIIDQYLVPPAVEISDPEMRIVKGIRVLSGFKTPDFVPTIEQASALKAFINA